MFNWDTSVFYSRQSSPARATKAADATTASVESLAEGLKLVGPLSAAAGRSLEETVAALATLDQAGLGGTLGGTGLTPSVPW